MQAGQTQKFEKIHFVKGCSRAGHAYSLSKRVVERQAMAFGGRKAGRMYICPGLIDTSMGRAEAKAHLVIEEMRNKTPPAHYGAADEIASVAAFLCSPDASFVTGSAIKVDGAVMAVR